MAIRGKVLRKTIILLLVIWMFLLAVLYLTSGKYRDHGITILQNQLNKNLLTEIQIRKDDIHFSLFKNFPNAAIRLENIYVKSAKGPDYSEFHYAANDTLLYAGKIDLVLDLWSLLTKKYVLKQVNIEDGVINLLTDSKGVVNYDVWLPGALSDSALQEMEYDIKKIEFKNLNLNYIDNKLKARYSGKIEKAEASGYFKNEDFEFKTKVVVLNTIFKYEKWILEHKKGVSSTLILAKQNGLISIKNGTITIYGIPVHLQGDYSILSKTYSLNCSMKDQSIQRLDKSFIDLYASDLKFYPKKGSITLNADISGSSVSKSKIGAQFSFRNGTFQNNELDIKVENIYCSGSFTNGKYRNNSSSLFNLDTLHCTSGKSELAFSGSAQNFISPNITGSISGTAELRKLMFIKSISDQFIIDGIAHANFEVKGKLRSIKNLSSRDLKAVKLKGSIDLDKAYIEKRDKTLPEVTVSGGIRLKNLMEIDLEGLDVTTGQSHFRVNGSVDNLPQFSKDKSIFPIFRGTIRSSKFHIEDFLIEDKNSKEDSKRIELPDSVYLSGSFVIDKFYFDKFYATHVTGDFQYHPKVLRLNGFNMYSQGGRIESYQIIKQKGDRLYTMTKAEFSKLDIGDLFYAFNDFNLDVITHNNIDGTLSGNANIKATWDLGLKPVYDEITGHSIISIEKGELNDYQPMMGLSKFIKIDDLKHIKFDRMLMDINIRNKNLNIAQTHIKSSVFAISGSGDHRFDNSYTYKIQVQLADVLWRKAKNKKPQNTDFGYVMDDGLGRTTIPLIITGKDSLYTVSYDRKTASSTFLKKLKIEKDSWKNFRKKDRKKKSDNNMKFEWKDDDDFGEENHTSGGNLPKNDDEFIIEWDSD